jgi:hypothetical protein
VRRAIQGSIAASSSGSTCAPRRSKYGNQKVEVDGIRFDSKREAKWWTTLQQQQQHGIITDLKRQVRFALQTVTEEGERKIVGHYVADFTCIEQGRLRVLDAKGYRGDPVYRWKARHFLAQYGHAIEEI